MRADVALTGNRPSALRTSRPAKFTREVSMT
jgi:hypothetical protein